MAKNEGERPLFQVRFEAMTLTTDRVKSYRIDSSYTTSTDAFEFVMYDPERDLVDQLELQPVTLFINGAPQLTGRVECTERSDDSSIRVSGRDYISELVECSADPAIKLTENMALDAAILLACGPVGITGVVAEEDIGLRNIRTGITIGGGKPDQSFKEAKLQDYKVNPGEGLYEFCNRLAARHGVTIQPGTDRNQLVLSSPNYKADPAFSLVRKLKPDAGARNQILRATCRRDYSSWPTHVLVSGKEGKGGAVKAPIRGELKLSGSAGSYRFNDVDTGAEQEFDVRSPSDWDLVHVGRIKPTDAPKTGFKLYRLLTQRDTDSKNQAQLNKVAQRLMAERLKETLRYECTVRGHVNEQLGAIYSENCIVDVFDEVVGVQERLWIESKTFEQDESGAAVTRLICWRPNTFLI